MRESPSQPNAPPAESLQTDRPEFGTPQQDQATEPWFIRLRLIVFNDEQRLVGWLLFACLIGMPCYFIFQRSQDSGLVEIDDSRPLKAEFKIDLNQAEFGEMVVLPGVGKSLAQAIIDHRQSHGPFESVESIADVPGIGPKKLEKLIPFLLPITRD